ncbi:MAG: VWA domain-containing protein, partial [Akkermansiaceae bacterium]|nr:VWA domain-containing protein [Armatimonadota bacterium]
SDRDAEGDFVFPIPAGASVSSFAMYDGEKKMEARLLEQDEATRTYEEIVRRRKDPALLTFSGRAALRARLFPIPPHSERKLTLKLVTVLPRDGDAKKYAWTLIGPHLPGTARPQSVSVKVTVADGVGTLYSPTHDVQTKREGTQTVATWKTDSTNGATLTENPEFDLYITPKAGAGSVALSMLTYNAALPNTASLAGGARQSGYFLVVASPTLAKPDAQAAPRRVVIVMDRSGSMQGKKIEQAKSTLRFALGKLRPQDSFNVVTFSDSVEKFSPDPVTASKANLERANAFVDGIVADGGTNIHDGLLEGLSQFPERASGNTLLFFTDGMPTVGTTSHNQIVKHAVEKNGNKARTFVFGVGNDVDVPFLDTVAQSLRGDADYVRPDEDIEVKTSRFVAKTSSAVLENLKLSVEDGAATTGEIYPKPADLPDLFAGGQLVLVGRYTGASKAIKLILSGEANGKPQSFALNGALPDVDTGAGFLPRLWASRKIGYLMDDVRLKEDGPAKKEAVDQIIALSKEWGILTPYTALFVPEPTEETLLRTRVGGMGGGAGSGGGFIPQGIDSVATYDANNTTLASAPRSGESAVNTSQTARAQKSNAQVGNFYAYKEQEGADKKRSEDLAKRVQNVNQRTFVQRGNQWTDATYDVKKQKQIVKVKLYSPAYFALTRRNADFAKWASLGNDVVITANATQAVQFAVDGKETLTDAEVKALAGR